MDQEYILKIIKGEYPSDERERFFERLSSDKALMQEYARLKNKYVINTLPYSPGINTLLSKRQPKFRLVQVFTKIAAALFIPLLAWSIYNLIQERNNAGNVQNSITSYEPGTGVRYEVNKGIKAMLTLPDSTVIWLNSGSYLDVPKNFTKDNRIVYLSGEGYFDVESDKKSPFLIMTPNSILVKVTGTQFNLSCYENDKNMKLTLLKGSLELIKKNEKDTISVKPNEEVIINYKTLEDKLDTTVDTKYATAWKEGSLRFIDSPMDEVVRKMERWFGIQITVDNPDIYKQTFTADFDSESVTQVLNLLEISTNISHEIKGNRVRLSMSSK